MAKPVKVETQLIFPLPADGYVPHDGPMRLVDQVLNFDRTKRQGQVSATLRADAAYFRNGYFQAHWLIELMAQGAAALCQLLLATPDGEPAYGYLIAIRSYSCAEDCDLQPGQTLIADCSFEVEMTSIGHCHCIIQTTEGLLCGKAELTFLSEETAPS